MPNAMSHLEPPTVATSRPKAILFDEGHGQERWFSVSPTVDKGFSQIAALAGQQFTVAFAPSGSRFSQALLRGYDALVLAMGPEGQTQLREEELKALRDFVRGGGGILVLGTYTGDWHHEANLNRLIEGYGIAFNRDVVVPAGARPEDGFVQGSQRGPDSSCVVRAWPATETGAARAGLVYGLEREVGAIAALSSCSLYVDEGMAAPLFRSEPDSVILEPVPTGVGIRVQGYIERGRGAATLVAAARSSKVVAAGSWKLFLDAFIDEPQYGNRQLFLNILNWLAAAPAAIGAGGPVRPAAVAAAASPQPAEGEDPGAQTLTEQLRHQRALLAQMEKEVVLASGVERAALNVRIDDLKQNISRTERELDAQHDPNEKRE